MTMIKKKEVPRMRTCCPLCGATNIYRRREMHNYHCLGCKNVFTIPAYREIISVYSGLPRNFVRIMRKKQELREKEAKDAELQKQAKMDAIFEKYGITPDMSPREKLAAMMRSLRTK